MSKQNKTTATALSVDDFIANIGSSARQEEAKKLVALYKVVTKEEPVLWGPSIIGFGSYHYKYDSGREGHMCRAGFSPRKDKLSLYMMGGYSNPATEKKLATLRAQLGKHKLGASCLYINKLSDVDLAVLKKWSKWISTT
jgi:hypothetical protein